MSTLATTLRNAPKRTSAIVAMIAVAIIAPAALFAWGPERPTYTVENPADHVTFNSITNNPNIGDERNFVGIREEGTTDKWKETMPVQPGKSYIVRMYVHNNAGANMNKTATDVTAMFNLPTNTAKSLQVNGFLKSSNATPKEVYDHAVFTGTENFNLSYQTGSLKYYNNANGNGFTIPETIFTSAGAKLGYDKMDGNIPGCFQYAGYLTFIVKPQFAPAPTADFTIKKEVRKAGEKAFVKSVEAKPGDTLNYRMNVTNSGQTDLNNINLKDTLPKGITNVPGTVRIMNASNPGGAYIKDGDNLFKGGVNIGSYTAGSNAIVIFDAKVADNDILPTCGLSLLRNIATAQPEGSQPKDDDADVTVPKECTVAPVYSCDSLTVSKIDRTNFAFTGKATAQTGASIVNYGFDFGDGKTVTVASPVDVKHAYEKEGTYNVKMSVTVAVAGSNKTVTGPACAVDVVVVPADKPPVVPPVVVPPVVPPVVVPPTVVPPTVEKPVTELPTTGAASDLLTLLSAGALVASLGYYVASRRLI